MPLRPRIDFAALLRRCPLVLAGLVGLLCSLGVAAGEQQALRLGVPAYRESATVRAEFTPLVNTLAAALARPVELRILPPLVLAEAYAGGQIDLLLAGSQLQRQLRQHLPLPAPIATLRRSYRGVAMNQLAATLLARADAAPIRDFRQLARFRLAIPESITPEGGRELTAMLAQRGLPPVPAAQVRWTRSHEEAIRTLQRGEVDIALVRSGMLETMIAGGQVATDALKVLAARQSPGLPLAHTTAPIPEWAALPAPASSALERRQLALQLLALEVPGPADPAEIQPIAGFDPPADYQSPSLLELPAPAAGLPSAGMLLAVGLAGLLPGAFAWAWVRRREQRRLDQAQARLGEALRVLDSLPVGVWHRRVDGGIDFANARIREVMALDLTRLQQEPDYPALFPEAVVAELEAADAETRLHGTAHHRRIRLATPDGRLRELELVQVRTLDPAGRVDGVLSVAVPRHEASTIEVGALLSRYEELLARLSADLASAEASSMDAAIHRTLAALGAASAADRAYLFLFDATQTHADNTHEWCADRVEAQRTRLQDLHMARDYPWLLAALQQHQVVVIGDVADLPAAERRLLRDQGICSALVVPMLSGERLAGFVGLDDVRGPRRWQPAEQSLLRVVGEMLVHTLLRSRAERSLSEALAQQQAIIGALPDLLFVFDVDGHYLDVRAREPDKLLLSATQALSHSIHEVLPPDIAQRTQTALDRIFAGSPIERFSYEIEVRGEPLSFAAELVPLDAGHVLAICRDVTDRRRAELALSASEARYRALVDHSQSLIFQIDPSQQIRFVSRSAQRLLGQSPAALLGRSLVDLIARDDHECLRRYLQQLEAAPDRVDAPLDAGVELRFLQADGRRRWLHLVMTRIGSGENADRVGNAVDIQGRVEAREELAGVAAQLQAVIDAVPSYLFAKDADGRYRMVNRSCATVFGRTPAEMIGLTDFDLVADPAVAESYRAHDQQAMASEQAILVERERVPHADGNARWCQTVKMRWSLPGDPRPGVLGVATDIHIRIETEARLRHESELTTLLVRLALTYIDLPAADLAGTIYQSVQELARFVGADRGYVFRYDHAARQLSNTVEWCNEGIHAQIERLQRVPIDAAMAEIAARHFAGAVVELPDLSLLRDGAARSHLQAQGIQSLLSVPMMRGEACIGFVGFDWVRAAHRCSTGEIQLLTVFAQMLVNAQVHADAGDALDRQRRRLELVIEGTAAGTWIWWPQSGALEINERWAGILGYTLAELAPVDFETWRRLSRVDDLTLAEAALAAHAAGQTPIYEARLRMRHKDGHWVWVLTRGRIVERDAQGEVLVYAGTHQDVTAQVDAEERLRLAASVFTHSHEGILITDAESRILEINEAFTRITGHERAAAIGQRPGPLLKSGRHGPEFYRRLWESLSANGYWAGEIWNRRRSGEHYAQFLTISVVRDGAGQLLNYVALFSDITAQKQYQQRLEKIAHYDSLTGLPNRALLADRMRQAMAQARRRRQQLAVAFIDLDGFKTINDSHGHDVGDQFLREVGQRIRSNLRDGDTVSRLGGDEFVAVMIDLPDREGLAPLLQRLSGALNEPLQVGDLRLPLSASIGVSFYPQSEELDAEQLLRQADQAMYHAKHAGKRQLRCFDAALDQHQRQHLDSLTRLREALDRGELALHYQPIFDLTAGQVREVEALLRWNHPERGLLGPRDFLPLIDGDELLLSLGDWVLERALIDQRGWCDAGLDLAVSINIAARQLLRPGFVDELGRRLSSTSDAPRTRLTLEVVETRLIDDTARASDVIRACHALGVGVALDDFGTGYSSLSDLKHLPLTALKIDQSFVRDMLVDPEDLAIIEAILGLGRAFGLRVVAEGVETRAQADTLLCLGCTDQQGYVLARPMPVEQLADWLRGWTPEPGMVQRAPWRRGLLPLKYAEAEIRGATTLALRHPFSPPHPDAGAGQDRFARWLRQLPPELPADWRDALHAAYTTLRQHADGLRQAGEEPAARALAAAPLESAMTRLCQLLQDAAAWLPDTVDLPPLPLSSPAQRG
ncbi:MAG: EAL domain-containing protein [Xanthomonadales bacterium]|jgi:diguanylate cyclase (GGDEF)-like protein/PAS domain S-box-containing protein|nr:EAL domain-containing protein [Xanthomonadales bacterium]